MSKAAFETLIDCTVMVCAISLLGLWGGGRKAGTVGRKTKPTLMMLYQSYLGVQK